MSRPAGDVLFVTAVDLRLERQIGREPLGPERIHAAGAIADRECRDGRAIVLVAHAEADVVRGRGGEENRTPLRETDSAEPCPTSTRMSAARCPRSRL